MANPAFIEKTSVHQVQMQFAASTLLPLQRPLIVAAMSAANDSRERTRPRVPVSASSRNELSLIAA